MPFDGLSVTSPTIKRLRFGRARVAKAWCQFNYENGEAVCALGGLRGKGFKDNSKPAKYLRLAIGGDTPPVHIWNDCPGRTQEEVLALYDRAIELAINDRLATMVR